MKDLRKLAFQHFIKIYIVSNVIQLHICSPDIECDVVCKWSIQLVVLVKRLRRLDRNNFKKYQIVIAPSQTGQNKNSKFFFLKLFLGKK